MRWLRTADLVVLAARTWVIDAGEARDSIIALREAQRLTPQLAAEYLEELG